MTHQTYWSSRPATQSQGQPQGGRTRPGAWFLFGVAFLLLVLSLFAMDWLGGAGSSTVKFSTISSRLPRHGVSLVAFVYFKGLGYALASLAVLLALLALAATRRSRRLTWWSVGAGIVTVIACSVGTGVLVHDLHKDTGISVSIEPGFGVSLAALVLLMAAVAIPRTPG